MYYVYVLKNSINAELYKGFTKNLEKRIKEHNSGKNKYTSKFKPWEIIYFEEIESFQDARSREKFFKTGAGRDYLKRKLGI